MSGCPGLDQCSAHYNLSNVDNDTEEKEGAPDDSKWLSKELWLSLDRALEQKLNCDRRLEKQRDERRGDAAEENNQLEYLQWT